MHVADNPSGPDLLAELDAGADQEQRLVDLIRVDYEATLQSMGGFVGIGSQIRAIGIAAWGVLVGLAVQAHSTLLAAISLVLVALFAYSDAYHAALYRRTLARAIKIEALLDSYLERLGIDAENAEAIMRTRAKLENHDFGMQRNLRPLRVTDLFAARPKPIFLAVYPAIVLITAALIIKYSL